MPAAAIQNVDTDQLIAADKASRTSTDDLIRAHQAELKAQRPKFTQAESIGMGALQGGTLGFADEIGGAIEAGADAAKGKVKDLNSLVNSYRNYRDQLRTKFDQASGDNPISYHVGEAGGTVVPTLIPGLNIAKGATTAAKLASAARAGALIGAGTSNADVTKGEVGQLAQDTAVGAGTGAAVEGALGLVSPVAQGVADRFRQIPENRAVKAVTGQNISALRQVAGTTLKSAGDIQQATNQIRKVGRDILDEPGVITPLSKVEDIAPKLADARQKYGQAISDVADQIDTIVPKSVDAANIADNIRNYADKIPQNEAGKTLKSRLYKEAENFDQMGSISFQDAQKLKNQFKYKAVDADALVSNQDATNKIRSIIGNEMDNTVEKLSNPQNLDTLNMIQTGETQLPPGVVDVTAATVRGTKNYVVDPGQLTTLEGLADKYKLYKSKYGSFKAASDAATDRVQKNLKNRFISPSDYGIGSTAALLQGIGEQGPSMTTLAIGVGAAAANKFARERGSALAAKTADSLIKTYDSEGVQSFVRAAKGIADLAKKGNPAAILTMQALSQKSPEAFQNLDISTEGK